MYFLLEAERTMFLFQLRGSTRISREEQEKLYWNFLKFLNAIEREELLGMNSRQNGPPRQKHPTTVEINYGIFWDEYRSIELSKPQQPQTGDSEDGDVDRREDRNETYIQWLNDVGFKNIAKKIRESTEIDQNDDDMKMIAASLTRAQANAVRRRIDSLNEAIRLRKLDEHNPLPSKIQPQRRRDVRNIFTTHDMKTNGETTESLAKTAIMRSRMPPPPKGNSVNVKRYSNHFKEISDMKNDYSSPPPVLPKPIHHRFSQSVSAIDKHNDNVPSFLKSDKRLNGRSSFSQPSKADSLVRRTSASHLVERSADERERPVSYAGTNLTLNEKKERPHSEFIDTAAVYANTVQPSLNKLTYGKTASENSTKKRIEDQNEQTKNRFVTSTELQPSVCKTFNQQKSLSSDFISNKSSTEESKKLVVVDSKYISSNSYNEKSKNEKSLASETLNEADRNINNNKNNLAIDSNESRLKKSVSSPDVNHGRVQKTEPNVAAKKAASIVKSQTQRPLVTDTKYSETPSPSRERRVARAATNPSYEHRNVRASPLVERRSVRTTTNSYSEDNKSVSSAGSLGSIEDGLSLDLKYKSSNSNDNNEQLPLADGDKSFGSSSSDSTPLSSSPRIRSPELGLDGDAKLNFGASTPKETESETVSGPSFPPLPNFSLAKEELGVTTIGDLCEKDMLKVKSLALIELTALFDKWVIPMNRRKAPSKLKFKDQGVFGIPLTVLCQRERNKKHTTLRPPRIFCEMLKHIERNGLQEEGLLRVPGSTPRVKAFREEADKNDLSQISWENKKVSDIATSLKQFLRDLPIPLLSHEYQNSFTSVGDLPERKVQLQALNLLVLLLHPVHQETLKMLLVFLSKIVANERQNKMGLNNVAMLMAPNLFFHNNATKININEAQKAAKMTDIMRMLIKYQNILWTVPAFMVSQIRFLYEEGPKIKPKNMRKIITKRMKSENLSVRWKSSGSSGDELEEVDETCIIRVKAPSLNKQSMAVQVTDKTTASDVLAKFKWSRQHSMKEKDEIDTNRLKLTKGRREKKEPKEIEYYLCETGGNIGERRLEPSTSLSAILKVNPNVEWVLKERLKK